MTPRTRWKLGRARRKAAAHPERKQARAEKQVRRRVLVEARRRLGIHAVVCAMTAPYPSFAAYIEGGEALAQAKAAYFEWKARADAERAVIVEEVRAAYDAHPFAREYHAKQRASFALFTAKFVTKEPK